MPEVLRIAVKIGSAIETAHRAGVLHRDIKPSNILTTAYGHPVLSDFGIASTLTTQREDDSVGLSIPWSAPEVLLDETSGTISSEVWALAATVYSLLAGRSPFEDPGGSNSSSDLMSRIARAKPQGIGRNDVPASSRSTCSSAGCRGGPRPGRRACSSSCANCRPSRPNSGCRRLPLEIAMDEWALGTVADLEDRTRLRPVPGAGTTPGAASATSPGWTRGSTRESARCAKPIRRSVGSRTVDPRRRSVECRPSPGC